MKKFCKKKLLLSLTAFIAILFLLLWLSGVFSPKISETMPKQRIQETIGGSATVHAIKVPINETAVGTVQSVHEVTISSKLLARVTEINVKAGQTIKKGEVLLRLYDSDLRSKLQHAMSNVILAEAAKAQAAKNEERAGKLVKTTAISKQEYENTSTRLKSADAELKMAQAAVNEIRALLDYSTISAPIDGIVIDKKVETGDTVIPGQVLLKLYDQKQMQIVAIVRESLTYKLKVGQQIGVKVDALNKICAGTVSEIVPESNSSSRSFLVKVTGPCPAGIYSGMFGRIIIPLEDAEVLVIPNSAVKSVGQLQLVYVIKDDGSPTLRNIRTGRQFGEDIEVLSGLSEDEKIINPISANYKQ